MALNYTDFFTVVGKYIKSLNTLFGFLTQITTGLSDIETVLEANTLNRLTVQLHPTFEQMKRDVEGWTNDIIGELRSIVITDRDFVRDSLILQNTDFNSIIQEIINDMINQSETVERSVGIAFGESFENGDTFFIIVGDETSAATANKLDAVTPPGSGFPASRHYADLITQLYSANVDYDLQVECVSTEGDGTEQMQIIPFHPETPAFRDQVESPGSSDIFPSAVNETIFGSEGLFNDFVSNSPIGWTMGGGVELTDWAKYNVSFREDFALVIKSANVTLTKSLLGLTPGRGYFSNLMIANPDIILSGDHVNTGNGEVGVTTTLSGQKKDGTIWTSTITVTKFTGGVSFEWLPARHLFIPPLNIIPETITITFEIDPDTNDWTIIDEAVLVPARYWDSMAYMATRGKLEDALIVGEKLSSRQQPFNNNVGVFQSFFRKAFKFQLPTATSGSETIADSLAE